MRRGRIITAVAALAGAAVVGVPGALAATPQQIYKDYQDNGRLDGAYSQKDLNRALRDAGGQEAGLAPVHGRGSGPDDGRRVLAAAARRRAASLRQEQGVARHPGVREVGRSG